MSDLNELQGLLHFNWLCRASSQSYHGFFVTVGYCMWSDGPKWEEKN